MSTRRTLRKRLAIASLASALTLGIAANYASGPTLTDAAWNDSDVATASIPAEWASGGWAKQTTSAYTNYSSFWDRSTEGLTLDSSLTATSASSEETKYQEYGNTGSSNFGPSVFGAYPQKNNKITGCAQAANALKTISADHCPSNSAASPNLPSFPSGSSTSQTRAKGYGRSSVIANPSSNAAVPISWIIAANVFTAAECRPDGSSVATPPVAGSATGSGNYVRLRASADLTGNVSDTNDLLVTIQANKTITGWVQPKWSNSGKLTENYWRYQVTARSFTDTGYALSDLVAKVDIFRISDKKYLGTHESVLSRSECAVTTPIRPRFPVSPTFDSWVVPAFPASGLPAVQITEASYPDPATGVTAAPKGFAAIRSAPGAGTETLTTSAVSASTPPETSTGTVTTTSAPPNPSPTSTAATMATATVSETPTSSSVPTTPPPATAATSTTTTSTTSAKPTSTTATATVPTSPPALSATEQTVRVASVTVNGSATDAVVKGNTEPADAAEGATVLETWINQQVQVNQDWTIYTSTDPDTADGYRWAAINQTTGTVVYIR